MSWHDPLLEAQHGAKLSGLEHLRAIAAGELSPGPLATVLGFEVLEIEQGRVVLAARPDELHYNHTGSVHGGFVCALLDQATGAAVQSTLRQEETLATVQLNVNLVRRLTSDSGRLLGQGEVIHVGRRTITAAARIVDEDGQLHAHATATCLRLVTPLSRSA